MKKADDTSLWDKYRGKIYSSKGGWLMGRGVMCHGYEMMQELAGHASYMQVIILNATGRFPERRLADWFEAIHICLSWPDSRIWCNHIGALAGTARATSIAATAAGLLANDSRSYGARTLLEGLSFIQKAYKNFKAGQSVAEIVTTECDKHGGKPNFMGYARPIAKGDERVSTMLNYAEELGFKLGEHMQLALAIDEYLLKHYNESININGYTSAFCSDQGFSPAEIYRILSILVSSGVTACYVDTANKPADTFLPLQCKDIEYTGKDCRTVPDVIE